MGDFDCCAARARADADDTAGKTLLYVLAALDEAKATIARVRELHTPETRWQTHPDQEWSYDSAEEALDDDLDLTEADLHTFLICAECGRIEMSPEQHGDLDGLLGLSYLEALWPCTTSRALDGPGEP